MRSVDFSIQQFSAVAFNHTRDPTNCGLAEPSRRARDTSEPRYLQPPHSRIRHCRRPLTNPAIPAILKHMLNQDVQLDLMFRALADSSRRSMLRDLGSGPRTVSELARPFSMSLAGVVQHVQILESSGLISSTKVGRTRTCRLNHGALSTVEKWIVERQSNVERQLDRLGELLDSSINEHNRREI